jgi:putative membrane protein
MKHMTSLWFATALAVSLPLASRAAEHEDMRDAHFIRKAAEGNNGEIQMAQMVAERTQDAQLRSYCDRLIRDHSQANQQLRQIADAKGVEFPAGANSSAEHEMHKLEKKSGHDLDRAAADHWVKDHKKDIKEYETEANHAKDPQVKQYAISTLPTLREHLNLAESLASSSTIREPAGSAVHRGDTVSP